MSSSEVFPNSNTPFTTTLTNATTTPTATSGNFGVKPSNDVLSRMNLKFAMQNPTTQNPFSTLSSQSAQHQQQHSMNRTSPFHALPVTGTEDKRHTDTAAPATTSPASPIANIMVTDSPQFNFISELSNQLNSTFGGSTPSTNSTTTPASNATNTSLPPSFIRRTISSPVIPTQGKPSLFGSNPNTAIEIVDGDAPVPMVVDSNEHKPQIARTFTPPSLNAAALARSPLFARSSTMPTVSARAQREKEGETYAGVFSVVLTGSALNNAKLQPGEEVRLVRNTQQQAQSGSFVLSSDETTIGVQSLYFQHLGYLPKQVSSWVSPLLDTGKVRVSASLPLTYKYQPGEPLSIVIEVFLHNITRADVNLDSPKSSFMWPQLAQALQITLAELLTLVDAISRRTPSNRPVVNAFAQNPLGPIIQQHGDSPITVATHPQFAPIFRQHSSPAIPSSKMSSFPSSSSGGSPFASNTNNNNNNNNSNNNANPIDVVDLTNENNELFVAAGLKRMGSFESLQTNKKLRMNAGQLPASSNNFIGPRTELSVEQHLDRLFMGLSNKVIRELDPPPTLKLTMRSYQKQALAWMVEREKPIEEPDSTKPVGQKKLPSPWREYTTDTGRKYYHNPLTGKTQWEYPTEDSLVGAPEDSVNVMMRGGILADEMGMGKTIEILGLILTNRWEARPNPKENEYVPCKTTLIVCPLSVINQWLDEIRTHTPTDHLSVYVYHGANRNRDPAFLAQHDIVLTTFSTLSTEVPPDTSKRDLKRPVKEERAALLEVPFFRVVLDEAHTIKDRSTRTAKAAFALKAERRWCVTGTPIQNKLDDLFSLLHFLRVEPYGEYQWWSRVIMRPIRNKEDRGFGRLQKILELILLRRTKDQRIDDKPIVSLPPKIVRLDAVQFRSDEEEFYQALWASSKAEFSNFFESGKVLENYAHILELLLRLRQACDHPLLVRKNKNQQLEASQNQAPNLKAIATILSEASPQNFSRLKAIVADGIDYDDEECAICLESIDNAVVTPCGHVFCKSCIEQHITSETGMESMCPMCRRTLMPNLLFPVPKKIHTPEEAMEKEKRKELEFRSSTKIDALMQELTSLPPDEGIKSIVFSQWTSMLDLAEIPLRKAGIKFVRLDGSMPGYQREKSVAAFKEDPSVRVFLISMKAGGLGLNLVTASHVYLLDPWWNPATEDQAIDRVHRLGQTRPVHVTRFIIKGSIEERIMELQDRKKMLAQGALGAGTTELRQIRIDELRLLFRD